MFMAMSRFCFSLSYVQAARSMQVGSSMQTFLSVGEIPLRGLACPATTCYEVFVMFSGHKLL